MGIVDDARAGADWIARALTSSGYGADFTPSSLWEVERFLDEQAPNGQPRRGGLLSSQLGQRVFALGAYVGEVIIRATGGSWEGDDTDDAAEVNIALVLSDEGTIWPVQRVMNRLQNGSEDSITAYVAVLGVDPGPKPDRGRGGRRFFRK